MIHLQTIYPHGIPQGEIARFIESSFGVFLLKQSRPNWQMSLEELATKFAELQTHNLIHHQPNGTYLLTKLGWESLQCRYRNRIHYSSS